ncbi:MAG: excinuclease ABC subunit UvrA [Actinomyces sp.]|nr:excinuclease ABC subunit UvrA [Actinomyces sp.]MCI1642361.1 excinuclease ABC subunit UvrA [Actinomyces sp.]MCI1662671.1 excinuclease ABC subunit UvrA [Actinomyces sp.]MCI1691505.1 excinuclease ABC subunit UvrA [Actinomyces sp.]MCI1787342.1 excinuclease ABC subunit UvrA [Actinomyces sp.]MCI1830838.1 excinuclease ABC subunit UvrA [Actinomyces sp.]
MTGAARTSAPPLQGRRAPAAIEVRGARVHNLDHIDVSVPLGELVAIAGVSGSGKSSLALGVLYAEGSRRYLEALSTYTRRRLTQAPPAAVDSVDHVPAALALHQRPAVPGVRSTFGTSTELLNSLRLVYSRLGSHLCPNGHRVPPSMDVALERPLVCPVCGVLFDGPGAESFAFNSAGACPRCAGTGVVRDVDEDALVPDPSKTIEEGAVESWKIMGSTPNPQVVAEFGVRTDVPFRDLTPAERDIVLHGPREKRHIMVPSRNGRVFSLNWTYRNARVAVEEALAGAKSEKGLQRIRRFLTQQVCPECGGSRLSRKARSTLVDGRTLAQASAMTLDDVVAWLPGVAASAGSDMRAMAGAIVSQTMGTARRLQDLGLGYLALDRASATLSTGERQRVQLARAVRTRTTGVLYVLDEPSIGLHPSNIDGLLGVIRDLLADGNSVVLVDHDVQLLREADWLIEIGPGSGAAGGRVVAEGPIARIADPGACPGSRIGAFLGGRAAVARPAPAGAASSSTRTAAALRAVSPGDPAIRMSTGPLHTVRALDVWIPRGRLTAVSGVSGSGKTTMVLECLVPAVRAAVAGGRSPAHVRSVDAPGIRRVNLIDASPIGQNVRSTVATYSGVMDDLRRAYAGVPEARAAGWGAGDFSYNTGSLRCPTCGGTGQISLDVQFLPDVDIVCPDCAGSRYGPEADRVRRGGRTLPEVLALTVDRALDQGAAEGLPAVESRLRTLAGLGLGYLTLGEDTPALSGGEAQRLKLASEMTRDQGDTLFVFDEPTVGLHPLDVEVLLGVLQRLLDNGATVVAIEHDLDVLANADWVIDLGPGGGEAGGRIVATGTPREIAAEPASVTGRYLAEVMGSGAGGAPPSPRRPTRSGPAGR